MDEPSQQTDWQQPIRLVELFGGIGAGLAAVVRNGIAVKQWIHMEQAAEVRKIAEHHAWELHREFPELLRGDVIKAAMSRGVNNVKAITEAEVASWGHVDLLVAGWECQGVSWAGKGKGELDPRTKLMEELFKIMEWVQARQSRLAYLLEHLDMEGDVREPARLVGQERQALPTLVSYEGAAGYRMDGEQPGPGLVLDHRKGRWEEPTALERELAMGYKENSTAAPGVNEKERRQALGNAMDGYMMRWLVQRMWKETVPHWGLKEGENTVATVRQGVWACLQKEEPEWRIGENMSEEGKAAMRTLLAKHRKGFAFTLQELGKCKIKEMALKLSSEEPVFHRRRKMPSGDEEICREKIKELLEAGLIRRSESEYATPTVVAARKDLTGEVLSRRMCGDYRDLNKITVPDRYPMPMAEELFDKLADGVFFTTLDLRQGFNQIKIREEDVKKTAFHGPDGLYEWLCMPFGLRNASAVFQRIMDAVLQDIEHAACYIDDVVVFSLTEQQPLEDVERTLSAIEGAGLTCHPNKCRWGEQTVQYLGRFVPNFSKRATVLNGMLREDKAWEWGEKQREALQDLMTAVKAATVLRLPAADQPFILYTDWSSQGMGAILCQEVEGVEKVVAYTSRSCNPAEAQYSSYIGEGLAAVWA
ncbi:unnamed protein product, partial [Closterium sp. NIES-53]